MTSNDKDGVVFAQPTTDAERREVAAKCCAAFNATVPFVVDTIDDRVGHLYSGMPDRLYLIDRAGKIAYKGGRGPFGFKPPELEQQIAMMLAEDKPTTEGARFPVLSNDEAWTRLPAVEAGGDTPLPAWARVTAATLPRTTATILELDDLHRTKSPLDPKLRAMARWVIAEANRCKYSEFRASIDLIVAGGTQAEAEALRGDRSNLPVETRRVLDVVRELTRAAYKVTDDQMALLRQDLGEPKLVALVQLVAFGNFQDRLLLCLGIDREPNGPLPPTGVRFKRPFAGGVVPPRPELPKSPETTPATLDDPQWRSIDFAALQMAMEGQRDRPGRVSIPRFADIKHHFPEGTRPVRIKWSLVCWGHSPVLAGPWTAGLRSFAEESKQDRVFEELLFWVVTRELQCFY